MTSIFEQDANSYLQLANERKLKIYLGAMIFLGAGYVAYFALISAWLSLWGPFGFMVGISIAWFMRSKHMIKGAGLLLAITLWAGPTWSSLVSGGVWSPIIMWLIPPILIAGFLNGMNASILVGALSAGSTLGMYFFNDQIAAINELTEPTSLTLTKILSAISSMGYVVYFAYENNRQTRFAVLQATQAHEETVRAQAKLDTATKDRRAQELAEAERLRQEAHFREENSRVLALDMEENASRIASLAKSVRDVSEMMTQADHSTKGITEHAREGGKVVEEAIAAMRKAQQSSSNIATISSAIEEIATQTNLLALNAQIEAARAGQAGRGFAVVAGEVQALAARAQHAAQDINRLTGDSGKSVNLGAEAVDRANLVLGDIIKEVEKTADQIAHVAHVAKEQATTIEEINGAASQIDARMQDLSRPYLQAAE